MSGSRAHRGWRLSEPATDQPAMAESSTIKTRLSYRLARTPYTRTLYAVDAKSVRDNLVVNMGLLKELAEPFAHHPRFREYRCRC